MAKQFAVFKHYNILRKAEATADEVLFRQWQLPKDIDYAAETNKLIAKLNEGATLDDILIDAYALASRAIHKVYGIKMYKVQIMGAYALHQGDVAEMRTGEGKTLTAILPTFLNALTKKGVHVVTVNEYLSQRDAYNTSRVYSLLGLTTGCVLRDQDAAAKKLEYAKDITYTTNSELGFDYLRDNMVDDLSKKTQRPFNFAVIDEADSILIDEARTPLIIAGGSGYGEEQYRLADTFAKSIKPEDFFIDKETKGAFLTETGVTKAEKEYGVTNLYSFENSLVVHRIQNALHANYILKYDVDYTVKDGEIVLIDIFTGRLLPGRSFSEGLNQALEAKENVKIKPETKVVASITYQNLFRMYKKLSGMTGTAITEEEEFINVYNMRVIPIPTNKGINRIDHTDLVFSTKKAKMNAVVKKIEEIHATSQPILVGTRSVQDSEELSKLLVGKNIPHVVLNAKNNAREAEIVEQAGQKNAITISTNMAGRGTDIKLGEGVIDLGGLYVIGTERHEARRIDNQLRGRAGRQGDIGHSQFFLSLEDEVLVRAGLKKLQKFANSLDETPLKSKTLTKAVSSSQKKIEGLNYDSRKQIVEYDDVMNRQRILTYKQRDIILESEDLPGLMMKMSKIWLENQLNLDEVYENTVFKSKLFIEHINKKLDFEGENVIPVKDNINSKEAVDYVIEFMAKYLANKFKDKEKDDINSSLRRNMVMSLDYNWQNQLDRLAKIKSFIHYRQYAQKNPIQAYLAEADKVFAAYKGEILEQIIFLAFRTGTQIQQPVRSAAPLKRKPPVQVKGGDIKDNKGNTYIPSFGKIRDIKDFDL